MNGLLGRKMGCLLGGKSRITGPGAVTALGDMKCEEVTWQSWRYEGGQADLGYLGLSALFFI